MVCEGTTGGAATACCGAIVATVLRASSRARGLFFSTSRSLRIVAGARHKVWAAPLQTAVLAWPSSACGGALPLSFCWVCSDTRRRPSSTMRRRHILAVSGALPLPRRVLQQVRCSVCSTVRGAGMGALLSMSHNQPLSWRAAQAPRWCALHACVGPK